MIQLAPVASNAMLDALGSMMDGGRIELMAGERVLAVMQLSIPAAKPAANSELEFNNIAEEDAALSQGNATTARIVDQAGELIFDCTVGDENSDAVIKLNTTKIYRGGPVRLKSFRLVMP